MKIIAVDARQIFNTKGFGAVECQLTLSDGATFLASVPSGTSRGTYEAIELKADDTINNVQAAVLHIQKYIAPLLVGKEPDVIHCDDQLLQLDGTPDKSNLGANAMLAVSIATVRAQAYVAKMPLYQLIAFLVQNNNLFIPTPQFNMLSGGLHASNGSSVQEFMIIPVEESCFGTTLNNAMLISHELESYLKKYKNFAGISDEGAFIVNGATTVELLDILTHIVETSRSMQQFCIGIDAAATHFYNPQKRSYIFEGEEVSYNQLIDFYRKLVVNYPIVYLEDGLAEDDWDGWHELTLALGNEIQVVGDDLFVTHLDRLKKGIECASAHGIIIKPNQVGTVTEALETITLAQEYNYTTIISHRSVETEDAFIADLAVGVGANQIKAGGCRRSERLAKYNQLLRIEDALFKNFNQL